MTVVYTDAIARSSTPSPRILRFKKLSHSMLRLTLRMTLELSRTKVNRLNPGTQSGLKQESLRTRM